MFENVFVITLLITFTALILGLGVTEPTDREWKDAEFRRHMDRRAKAKAKAAKRNN